MWLFPVLVDVTLIRAAALVAVLALACAFGLFRRARDGRARSEGGVLTLGPDDLGSPLGARATLVQFSTEFCAPCRSARRVLARLAGDVDGVRHVELDATEHLELVRRLDVRRTPTVLVLDAAGRVRTRAVGVPDPAELADLVRVGRG